MVEVSQETMDRLVEQLGEEQALDFLEQAESQEQIDEMISEPKAEHTGATNGDTFGWSVVECRYKTTVENEDGEEEEVEKMTGYCLRFQGPKRTVYCGRSQAEFPWISNVSDPWSHSQLSHAHEVCKQKGELLEKAPVRTVRRVSISVLTTIPKTGDKPKTVQKKLTQRQQDALSTLREAYAHAPGYSVNADSDVVAVILDAVADVMRLPK